MSPNPPQQRGMTALERRATLTLAGLFSLRMLGLFLILPVFSLYGDGFSGATPLLIGLAIGAYGLTQAVLQIPFGIWSDRFGRRPIIVIGLLVFALGSVVAAMSDTIYGVILGRCLQGAGSIAAAIMALAADLTREEQRTKAMAMIGMSIGLSFGVALVLGPVLGHAIGIAGIFWLTAGLAVLGLLGFLWGIPADVHSSVHRDAEPVPALFGGVLRDGQLLRLNAGIFALHLILTASFVALPLALRDSAGLAPEQHWTVYLPVMLLSVLCMVPFIILAERYRRMKSVFLGAILALGVAEFGLMHWHLQLMGIAAMLLVFFTAINLLEASLPSLVSKIAPPGSKGTAMGFYTTFQFSGAFLGGVSGGWLYGHYGVAGVFACNVLVALVWLLLAASMKNPRYLTSYLLKIRVSDEAGAQALARRLTGVRGVAEAVVIAAEGVAYLKVDKHALDEDGLREFSAPEG